MPFFTLGYLIHDKQEIISNISNKSLIYIIIFGCFLSIMEAFTIPKAEFYIGTIFISVSLFAWCVKNPNTLNFKITGFIGGKLYVWIYILHILVYRIVKKYLEITYFTPIIIFIITVIISLIIYLILKQVKKIL